MRTNATITLDKTIMDRLRSLAANEKRSVSQQLELMLEKHFGMTTRPSPAPRRKKEAAPR